MFLHETVKGKNSSIELLRKYALGGVGVLRSDAQALASWVVVASTSLNNKLLHVLIVL